MIIHIVKQGDTLKKICDGYHILMEDVVSNNKHITDFNNLLSGTKIKIPFLSKDIQETLEETESFIEDYYPQFDKLLQEKKQEEMQNTKEATDADSIITITKQDEQEKVELIKDEPEEKVEVTKQQETSLKFKKIRKI